MRCTCSIIFFSSFSLFGLAGKSREEEKSERRKGARAMSLGMSPTWQLAHEDIHHFGSMYTHMYNISGEGYISNERRREK
jgi:hypothetical protein